MPTSTCLVCGHGDLTPVRRYRAESASGKALFGSGQVTRCAACGQPQLSPLPSDDELSRYYATEYRKGGRYGADAADLSAFPKDNLFFYNRGVSITELLRPRLTTTRPLRILDVGAGYGHILQMLGEAFPTATRVAHELSEPCVAHLRRIGVLVLQGDLSAALAGHPEPFDVIVLSHVLEHLRTPVETLAMLRSHLRPEGLLYVEVPHVSPDALTRYPDSPWAPRHDEPHLTFFGAAQLRALLERAGYRADFVETAGPAYRDVSALRYALPPLMPTVRRLVPRSLLQKLQRQQGVQRATLPERSPDFYAYGGYRIWLRSVSQPA